MSRDLVVLDSYCSRKLELLKVVLFLVNHGAALLFMLCNVYLFLTNNPFTKLN